MRDAYHEELDAIGDALVEMAHLVGSAMDRATTAVLDADLQVAESVIGADDAVDDLHHSLEARAFDLLARQQPVATDLRIIVTSLRMSSDLERMGDLARHVAKVARLRYPDSAIPPELRATIQQMGHLATEIVAKTGSVLASKDVQTALAMDKDDDAMDALHRQLFHELLDDRWTHGVEKAIDITLLSRYYERFADHAVSVARRLVYLVTGEYLRTDAPA